jgi:hypothetical protein
MYRDNIHVIHTSNVKATALFIKTVYDKCIANPNYFSITSSLDTNVNVNDDYLSSIKIKSKKCENIDVNMCYLLQLCQIPGISHRIAKEIAKTYTSYGSLIDALRSCTCDAEKIKLLTQINLIAVKKASKIVEYITCD